MKFIALTPNLAIDRILTLDKSLQPGDLHRVTGLREVAGGKGVNVARVLNRLGADVKVAGFLAGFNGQKFRYLLKQEGLAGVFQEIKGETRECQILLNAYPQAAAAHPTEIYEMGPAVTVDDWKALMARIDQEQLIISGSMPGGMRNELFAELIKDLTVKPIVDARGQALKAALEASVALIKPNKLELASIVEIKDDGIQEARILFEQYGVPILLSLGERGAAYVAEKTYLVEAPGINVVNPIASGDSLLAAFLWAQQQNWAPYDALRLGVAAGAENAATGGGARFSKEGLMKRLEQVI